MTHDTLEISYSLRLFGTIQQCYHYTLILRRSTAALLATAIVIEHRSSLAHLSRCTAQS